MKFYFCKHCSKVYKNKCYGHASKDDWLEFELQKDTISSEREFIETLLYHRFQLYMVVFAIVVGGATQIESVHLRTFILYAAFVVSALFGCILFRTNAKLKIILNIIFLNEGHAASISDKIAQELRLFSVGRSVRKLVGVWIPLVCTLLILALAILSPSDCLWDSSEVLQFEWICSPGPI